MTSVRVVQMTHSLQAKRLSKSSLKQICDSPDLIQIKQTADKHWFSLVFSPAKWHRKAQVKPTDYCAFRASET